ncbi:MAG: hypothetical protein VX705_01110, partial [Verrucomicrobiota bacterium]|nr:hypothetical protein [Verrucomicrobiota bacterium]
MTDHLYQRLCTAGLLLAAAAWAQLPVAQLTSHYPGGGQQGATMEVHVTGSNLDTPARLHFSHPGITSVPLKGSPENPFLKGPRVLPGRFNVTIAPGVPVGVYELRVASRFG